MPVPGVPNLQGLTPYDTILTLTDGDSSYDTEAEVAALINAAPASGFVPIWRKTVPPQTAMAWGSGNPQYQVNQGVITFAATDEGTANDFSEGIIRLVSRNAFGNVQVVNFEVHTGALHSVGYAANLQVKNTLIQDLTQLPKLPLQTQGVVGENSLLEIQWQGNVADTDGVAFRIAATTWA